MNENITTWIGCFIALCVLSALGNKQCASSIVDNPFAFSDHYDSGIWISTEAENLLKSSHLEGLRLTAYKDAASYSVGYGHYGVAKGTTITKREAENFLQSDLQQTKDLIEKYIKHPERLDSYQIDALFLFFYNIGDRYRPSWNLHKMINENPNDPEIWNQWQKYNRSQGKVLEVLKKRRKLEANIYFYNLKNDN